MRNSANARNEAASASANHALRAAWSINLPDRASTYIVIGAGVQIADRAKWIVEYRAIAQAAGNLIVERGRRYLSRQIKNVDYQNKLATIPRGRSEHLEIIVGGDALVGDQCVDRDPTNTPDGEGRETGRSSSDRLGEVEFPDGAYWVVTVNDNMMRSPVKSPICSVSNWLSDLPPFCISERGCRIDPGVFFPTNRKDYDAISSARETFPND